MSSSTTTVTVTVTAAALKRGREPDEDKEEGDEEHQPVDLTVDPEDDSQPRSRVHTEEPDPTAEEVPGPGVAPVPAPAPAPVPAPTLSYPENKYALVQFVLMASSSKGELTNAVVTVPVHTNTSHFVEACDTPKDFPWAVDLTRCTCHTHRKGVVPPPDVVVDRARASKTRALRLFHYAMMAMHRSEGCQSIEDGTLGGPIIIQALQSTLEFNSGSHPKCDNRCELKAEGDALAKFLRERKCTECNPNLTCIVSTLVKYVKKQQMVAADITARETCDKTIGTVVVSLNP